MGLGRPARNREIREESWATVACFSARRAYGYLYVGADAIRTSTLRMSVSKIGKMKVKKRRL